MNTIIRTTMKRKQYYLINAILLLVIALTPTLYSCGSVHSYWGVESDYHYDSDGHKHGGKKPKKPKKPKKDKHHHHDHDRWDD